MLKIEVLLIFGHNYRTFQEVFFQAELQSLAKDIHRCVEAARFAEIAQLYIKAHYAEVALATQAETSVHMHTIIQEKVTFLCAKVFTQWFCEK